MILLYAIISSCSSSGQFYKELYLFLIFFHLYDLTDNSSSETLPIFFGLFKKGSPHQIIWSERDRVHVWQCVLFRLDNGLNGLISLNTTKNI